MLVLEKHAVSFGADLGIAQIGDHPAVGPETEADLATQELSCGARRRKAPQERRGIGGRHRVTRTEVDRILERLPHDRYVEDSRSVARAKKDELIDQG